MGQRPISFIRQVRVHPSHPHPLLAFHSILSSATIVNQHNRSEGFRPTHRLRKDNLRVISVVARSPNCSNWIECCMDWIVERAPDVQDAGADAIDCPLLQSPYFVLRREDASSARPQGVLFVSYSLASAVPSRPMGMRALSRSSLVPHGRLQFRLRASAIASTAQRSAPPPAS